MDYMCYADDSQIYIVIRPSTLYITISRVERCICEIQKWMEENLLKLNEDKTEILLIAPPRKQHHLNNITFTFGGSTIVPSDKIKNIGCWWNTTFSMDTQADYIVRICKYKLRKVNRIKRYLTPAALKTLFQSLVISRLDYGNTIFMEMRTRKGYGDRCFTIVAPQLWNNLPDSLKCAPTVNAFRSQLKTHLFTIAYVWSCDGL